MSAEHQVVVPLNSVKLKSVTLFGAIGKVSTAEHTSCNLVTDIAAANSLGFADPTVVINQSWHRTVGTYLHPGCGMLADHAASFDHNTTANHSCVHHLDCRTTQAH